MMEKMMKENTAAAKVLSYLMEQAGDDGMVLDCSYFQLSEALNLPFPTLSRAVQDLKEAKLVEVFEGEDNHIYKLLSR